MQQGMRIAASGAMVAMYRTDVLAANLANVNTVGFKPDSATTQSRLPVRQEDNLGFMPSDPLLEQLGAGVLAGPKRISFNQGPLESTGNDLDLAIEGDGFFMISVQTANGAETRLSRDGRLTRDDLGRLVQSVSGLPVLGPGGSPIQLPPGPVTIDHQGAMYDVDGNQLAQIAVASLPSTDQLKKLGEGLYAAPPQLLADANIQPLATGVRVHQGMVEGSAVDPIRAMMDVTRAGQSVNGNSRMMRYHDQLLDQAINTFARVG
ncbi:MAG: flagellar hook-basal body protein [Phycisphaerales bacterium]|nr:flagellar hook-basal body protein [Phycisphaerales bacterium]